VNQILSLPRRILFLSGADFGADMNSTIFAKLGTDLCNWAEPDYQNFNPFPTCVMDHVAANVGNLIRMPTSQLQYGPFNSSFHIGINLGVLTKETLPPVIECNINFPSPDLLSESKVEAMVWTWARGFPIFNATDKQCTVLDIALGRWISIPCYEKFSHSCRNVSSENEWTLGSPSTFDDPQCPKGYVFTPPLNAYQNACIKQKMVHKSVALAWINVLIRSKKY